MNNNTPFRSVEPLRRPRRFFTWRNARRGLLGVAGLVTLIAAVFVIENWRGRRAWAEAAALARSRGEPLTFSEIMPAPVPDEENLAKIPLLAPLFSTDAAVAKTAAERWPMPDGVDGKLVANFGSARGSVALLNALRADLGTDDLVAYMDRYADDLAAITSALQRPACRFPVRQGKTFDMMTSHVGPMLRLSRWLYLRALARVERGLAQGAGEDVVAMLRLAKAFEDEPTLLGQLVGTAIANQGLRVVGFGLASGVWSDGDLENIETSLAKLNLVGSGWRALRGEMVFGLASIEAVMSGIVREREDGAADDPIRTLFSAAPSGWLDQNRARLARFYVEGLLPAYDAKLRRMDFPRLHRLAMELMKHGRSPYWVFPRQMASITESICPQIAMTQTQADLARIAIALERWRREKGSFPASLAEVVAAQGLTGLHDFATGGPLRYRLNADGTYVLYATGRDGLDGGAKAVSDDWVWTPR